MVVRLLRLHFLVFKQQNSVSNKIKLLVHPGTDHLGMIWGWAAKTSMIFAVLFFILFRRWKLFNQKHLFLRLSACQASFVSPISDQNATD